MDPDAIAARYRDLSGAELLAWFDRSRERLVETFRGLDPGLRVPWFGPAMSAASALTARIMETWAHGQDVADALRVVRVPTARLRHVAHIGVGARAFSYALHGRAMPDVPVRVELDAPDGSVWTWGPADAADRISGPALDFALADHPAAAPRRPRAGGHRAGRAGVGRDRAGVRGDSRARAGGRGSSHERRVPSVIGNCSGFYGDRISAAREMVEGGPIDVLCGDYLAELTMLILAKAQAKDPAAGYAKTFLTQVEQVLGTCLERGIRIVANAGGLNPAGLADGRAGGGREAGAGRERRARRGRRPARLPGGDRPARRGQAGVGQRLPGWLGDRRGPRGRRRRRRDAGGSPTPRSSSGPRRGGTAGGARTGTRWPARWSPGT